MGFFGDLNPFGNNFLGLGSNTGRVLANLITAGTSEWHKPDPMYTKPGTVANSFGKSVGGAGPGAVGGFITGGPYGAFAGGAIGGIDAGLGKTSNSTPSGFGENFGIGTGAGLGAGYLSGSGLFSGAGAAAGSGGAGAAAGSGGGGAASLMGGSSNLGGASYGMASGPLDLTPAYGSSTGAAAGSSFAGGTPAAATPAWQQALQNMRQMPGGSSNQPTQQRQNILAMIYKMMPNLRPGASSATPSVNMGGM